MAQNKTNQKLTRKQQRKEMRKQKKIKRNEYYMKRTRPEEPPTRNKEVNKPKDNLQGRSPRAKSPKSPTDKVPKSASTPLTTEQIRNKEQREKKKIEKDMLKTRKKQLLAANEEEDRVIKQLEKQLGLNKRKTKNYPKSFTSDGLDYLLEVCDPEKMKSAIAAEKELHNDDGFEEDFNLMTQPISRNLQESSEDEDEDNSEINEELDELESESYEESEMNDSENEEIDSDQPENSLKRSSKSEFPAKKKIRPDPNVSEEESENESTPNTKNSAKINPDGTWEDIYGRLRAKDGSVITKEAQTKYIPPAAREQLPSKSNEKLNRLRRELKGLLNRLAESNMHNISAQIENLYMNNSRNDMNETLMNLIMESIVSEVVTPERLLIEHVVLITVLHANIGTEIGAHFLQQMIHRFNELRSSTKTEIEDKQLDNNVKVLAQLYNFKLFDARLMYDILDKLSENFEEKEIECILHILKAVGFNLRKDDPGALKKLILDLQKRAAEANKEEKDNSRVKFMLDVLLAIKNNNVTKIPNYDVSYPEHLKKILKGLIRKGNYVTQLNISLEDLLKADEKGRWWVVGSAWTGDDSVPDKTKNDDKGEGYDSKLLQLAKKQRMNTDTRRNIFCIIMSAEDYLDAFEKILKLGLKNQQEREIINIILQCCLREKKYNPYYAYLAQKFCDYDRKYQMIIKYSIWDKLKALSSHSGSQISNLAKMLIHLFIEKGLPISTLKVVQFSEIDKVTLRFMRQILLGIFLHENEESCLEVFAKVTLSSKLKMFRESLRLFIHHFLLRNLKSEAIPEEHKVLLEKRARMVEKVLTAKLL